MIPRTKEHYSVLITGAAGFVGRQVVEAMQQCHPILALDWRPPEDTGASRHPNVRWIQADVTDRSQMMRIAKDAPRMKRPQLLLHLAAHYEFEQEDEEPYWRTNVEGTRNVFDAAVEAGIERVVLASSLAACNFPGPGRVLNEDSAPDADHIYARTKRAGEQMLAEYEGKFRSAIVRFAAMYSDYCEYPPLYKFLDTWLSKRWNRNMLGGQGLSSIPFLHVRDAARFLRRVVHAFDGLEDREVVIASPSQDVSHNALFEVSTRAYFGQSRTPVHIPKPLVRPGIYAQMLLGHFSGEMPFERPWMADFVDEQMRVDASRTHERLDWRPRPRLDVLERLPLLVENLRAYPAEWEHRNQGAMHKIALRPNLIIHGMIQRHRDEIGHRLSDRLTRGSGSLQSYEQLSEDEHAWNHRLALTQLMHTVRTRERKLFVDYCADVAARRHRQGFSAEEVASALKTLEEVVIEVLEADPASASVKECLEHDISVAVRFAIDEVYETYDEIESRGSAGTAQPPASEDGAGEHGGVSHCG